MDNTKIERGMCKRYVITVLAYKGQSGNRSHPLLVKNKVGLGKEGFFALRKVIEKVLEKKVYATLIFQSSI